MATWRQPCRGARPAGTRTFCRFGRDHDHDGGSVLPLGSWAGGRNSSRRVGRAGHGLCSHPVASRSFRRWGADPAPRSGSRGASRLVRVALRRSLRRPGCCGAAAISSSARAPPRQLGTASCRRPTKVHYSSTISPVGAAMNEATLWRRKWRKWSRALLYTDAFSRRLAPSWDRRRERCPRAATWRYF